jgi:hypothetical protein
MKCVGIMGWVVVNEGAKETPLSMMMTPKRDFEGQLVIKEHTKIQTTNMHAKGLKWLSDLPH